MVSSRDSTKFVRVDKISSDGNVRIGLFESGSSSLDGVVIGALSYIKEQCISLGYANIFSSYGEAVEHILNSVNLEEDEQLVSTGPEFIPNNSGRTVRHIPTDIDFGCVFSVPEFVGLNVVFPSTKYSGIIFHNIQKGLAFVDLQPAKSVD